MSSESRVTDRFPWCLLGASNHRIITAADLAWFWHRAGTEIPPPAAGLAAIRASRNALGVIEGEYPHPPESPVAPSYGLQPRPGANPIPPMPERVLRPGSSAGS